MPIETLDHLYVSTRDFDASLKFWESLGFREAQSLGPGRALLSSGTAEVMLSVTESQPSVLIYFKGVDLDRVFESVRDSQHVTVVQEPQNMHWGVRTMEVASPEGQVFALFEPVKESSEKT